MLASEEATLRERDLDVEKIETYSRTPRAVLSLLLFSFLINPTDRAPQRHRGCRSRATLLVELGTVPCVPTPSFDAERARKAHAAIC